MMSAEPTTDATKLDRGTIQWQRLAEPQLDQYDSAIALQLARERGYVRRSLGGLPLLFDGAVEVRNDCASLAADCKLTSHEHPSVNQGVELMRLWPEVFEQVRVLIEGVNLFIHEKSPWVDPGIGSFSGPSDSEFGLIATTVNSAVGFAGSIAHEMAHHKLRAFGVQFETAERLIFNSPQEKFRSPVRFDCLRPMSAVLQGQYAFTYSAAMCLAIVRGTSDSELARVVAERSLAVKLPKLVFGYEVIRRHAKTDQEGAEFLSGLFDWCFKLFDEGFAKLDEMKIAPKKFSHPLDMPSVVQ